MHTHVAAHRRLPASQYHPEMSIDRDIRVATPYHRDRSGIVQIVHQGLFVMENPCRRLEHAKRHERHERHAKRHGRHAFRNERHAKRHTSAPIGTGAGKGWEGAGKGGVGRVWGGGGAAARETGTGFRKIIGFRDVWKRLGLRPPLRPFGLGG